MFFSKKKRYTDAELVEGCVRNDRRAQEAFYRRFFPAMFRLCLRYAHDEETAISIVNQGFLRAFQKMHTYAFQGSLEGWLRRLVYHAAAEHFRRHARYTHFLVLEERDAAEPARPDAAFDEAHLLRLIEALPRNAQTVFRLYAIEGYSHAEIAERLGISEGTSKWYLSTARQRLREWLATEERVRG